MPHQDTSKNEGINRRDVLVAATAGVISTAVLAQSAQAEEAHNHGGNPYQDVIDASLHCVKTGEACIAHCLESFKAGDTSLAMCAATVQEMLSMCNSLSSLASLDSKHLKDLARVCASVCADCEKECRKHADHHDTCKACADSCLNCIKHCKAIYS